MGSQRVEHQLATKQQNLLLYDVLFSWFLGCHSAWVSSQLPTALPQVPLHISLTP